MALGSGQVDGIGDNGNSLIALRAVRVLKGLALSHMETLTAYKSWVAALLPMLQIIWDPNSKGKVSYGE